MFSWTSWATLVFFGRPGPRFFSRRGADSTHYFLGRPGPRFGRVDLDGSSGFGFFLGDRDHASAVMILPEQASRTCFWRRFLFIFSLAQSSSFRLTSVYVYCVKILSASDFFSSSLSCLFSHRFPHPFLSLLLIALSSLFHSLSHVLILGRLQHCLLPTPRESSFLPRLASAALRSRLVSSSTFRLTCSAALSLASSSPLNLLLGSRLASSAALSLASSSALRLISSSAALKLASFIRLTWPLVCLGNLFVLFF